MNGGAQKLIAIVGVILLAGVFFIAATTKTEATSQDTEGSEQKADGAWPAPESELLNPVLLSRYLGQPYAATRAHIYKDCFSRASGGCFYLPDLGATNALRIHVNASENTGFVRHIFWQAYSLKEGPATRDVLRRVEGTLPRKRSD